MNQRSFCERLRCQNCLGLCVRLKCMSVMLCRPRRLETIHSQKHLQSLIGYMLSTVFWPSFFVLSYFRHCFRLHVFVSVTYHAPAIICKLQARLRCSACVCLCMLHCIYKVCAHEQFSRSLQACIASRSYLYTQMSVTLCVLT